MFWEDKNNLIKIIVSIIFFIAVIFFSFIFLEINKKNKNAEQQLAVYNNEEEVLVKDNLQDKIKSVLSPQTCEPVEISRADGFISGIGDNTITVHRQDGEEITFKLVAETLFVEIETNEDGDLIYHEKEISFNDLSENDSVVVNYFFYEGNDELIAKIVKLIIFK